MVRAALAIDSLLVSIALSSNLDLCGLWKSQREYFRGDFTNDFYEKVVGEGEISYMYLGEKIAVVQDRGRHHCSLFLRGRA